MNVNVIGLSITVSLTIKELISQFELCNEADGKSPKTIGWYNDILISFLRYLKRNLKSDDISSFKIESVREYMLFLRNKRKFDNHPYTPAQNCHVSPQTVRGHTRALKAFSSWMFNEKYTAENILINLKLPKASAKLVEPLSSEEIQTIIGSINKDSAIGFRNYSIVLTTLDNGLRASELAGISLGQLNLKTGCIKVTGKGNKERIVPVGESVKMTLWDYINNIRPKSASDIDCDRLFLSRDGKPLTVNATKLMFSRLARSSGVKRLHAHLCRYTFAINYLLNGGDIFSLREILGHSSMEMVNHYIRYTSAQLAWQHHKYSPIDHLGIKNKLDNRQNS